MLVAMRGAQQRTLASSKALLFFMPRGLKTGGVNSAGGTAVVMWGTERKAGW